MNRYVGAIEALALNNTYFRQVLFTSEHAQLVVMSLQPGEEIGDEVHPDVDQFFRIERGEAKFVFDDKDECLAHDGDAVVVPAGTRHNVVNRVEDGTAEAVHDLLSAQPPGRHGAQDEAGGGGGRGGARLSPRASRDPFHASRRQFRRRAGRTKSRRRSWRLVRCRAWPRARSY